MAGKSAGSRGGKGGQGKGSGASSGRARLDLSQASQKPGSAKGTGKAADARKKGAPARQSAPQAPSAYRRVIIVGSPRVNGRSASLAEGIFEACIEDCPQDECQVISVSTLAIGPCVGCGACASLAANGSLGCAIDDDMAEVYEALDGADELIVVAPVYFAGPTAQLKALLDRMQPYFYTEARHQDLKPATLHVIGEGHDPFGYDPLVGIVQSALLCAGFRVETIFDWVGCIDETGQIVSDAQEYALVCDDDCGDAATDCDGEPADA